jgi:ferritin-like metal-binding protein YciE
MQQRLKRFFRRRLKRYLLGRKSINKALPKMAKNATASKLIHAFESHLKETEEHVTRLKIFESLSQSSCQEMRCNGGTT